MHTPGHAVTNVAILGAYFDHHLAGPAILGAVLPDVPIYLLYLDARLRLRAPDERIWSELYQRPGWLAWIHGMHSLPLAAVGLAAGVLMRRPAVIALFASLLLHSLEDLPVHGQDAHRHFWPFSAYRFISPLSYWDVERHARLVALVELAVVVAATVSLWTWTPTPLKPVLVLVLGFYAECYRRLYLPARRTATTG